MAEIESIDVTIQTSNIDNAGTDGDVYLGILGREFFLDTSADDFEKGSIRTYRLGDGTNVKSPELNDPRKPQLDTRDLNKNPTESDPLQNYKFPVYIRFEPSGSGPDWNIASVNVEVGGTGYGAIFPKGLWLGRKAGKICYLREGRFGE